MYEFFSIIIIVGYILSLYYFAQYLAKGIIKSKSIFFYKVEVAINSLDHTEARSIAKREEMLAKPQIENQIAYITSNFVHLKFAILKLGEKGISLEESTFT